MSVTPQAAALPSGGVVGAASKLLDFDQPVDVPLLDATINTFYTSSSHDERTEIGKLLKQLQEHPQMWTRVDAILEGSQNQQTRFFGLQILEDVIRFRWGALPVDQREAVRNYISNVIIKMCGVDEATFRKERVYLVKLNVILVHILKHDWPSKWPSFIPDIVNASRSGELLCENSMNILRLLSEEVFDFSRGQLTQAKIKELKGSLNSEFMKIYDLCVYALANSRKAELTKATLKALAAYLTWIPLAYIFDGNIITTLMHLFPQPVFRNYVLQCMTEIAGLQVDQSYDPHFLQLYDGVMQHLGGIIPPGTDLQAAYENSSDEEQQLLQNLALFFTTFLKAHLSMLEKHIPNDPQMQTKIGVTLNLLVQISYVNDNELFKTCLDYWTSFVCDIFSHECSLDSRPKHDFAFMGSNGGPLGGQKPASRKQLHAEILSKLRLLMICKMAKPEEIIIVEDENGNIVRETMKDNAILVQYRIMRETLVYLSHLDHNDTESQMLEKLALQLNGKEWSWQRLNTLCWAIGSISLTMQEEQENRFLVTVIRDLLNLCEITRGKDNKAVIASNIMYVVGQYPRFLRQHWKFLKTVVNKLFEFMHEKFEGVQDMACDTFLKICVKCRRRFVMLQVGETEPFICDLLRNIPIHTSDLQPHQVNVFYEAVGLMVSAEPDTGRCEEYLKQLMSLPNSDWHQIITQAQQYPVSLREADTARKVANILATNTSVCISTRGFFKKQLILIFNHVLEIYRTYSELCSSVIASDGALAARRSDVKLMRSVKRQALRLLETFLDKAEQDDLKEVGIGFVQAMLDPVLGDYLRSVPDARDAEVLSLFAVVVSRFGSTVESEISAIFDACFQSTLSMITKNYEEYPDHRIKFYSLLRAVVQHCFRAICALKPEQISLLVDSIVWAFRHTERNVAELGLNLLLELLNSIQKSEFVNAFYQKHCIQLVQEIVAAMTDSFHKPGFKLHVSILQHLFSTLANPAVVTCPIWDATQKQYTSNEHFVREHLTTLLSTSFPNLSQIQVQAVVSGMFDLRNDSSAFKNHLRDFLVQTKEFATQNNAELYAEETTAQRAAEKQRLAAIPGMVKPAELNDMNDM